MAFSFSDALALGNTALNLIGGSQASGRAEDAAQQSAALNQAQIDAMQKQSALFEAGGTAMETALAALLSSYDGRGQYDPQKLDDFAALLSQERAEGEIDTKTDIGSTMNEQKARQNQTILAELGLAQSQFAPTASNVGTRSTVDTTFNPNSYDAPMAALTSAYKANLDAVSKQDMDEAMSKMMTDSQRKLGGAVTGQQTVAARAMGEAMNEQNAKNSLNAINMAMKQMAGLQGMDTTLQNSNINAQGANINALNFDKNIQDMLFKQAITSADAGQKFLQSSQAGDRANYLAAIGQIEGINKLNQNTDLIDYNAALATMGSEQGMANSTIDTLQKLATAPYSYKAQGPAGILSSSPSAIDAANNALSTYATQAQGAFNAAGQGIDTYFKNSGFGEKSVADTFGFGKSNNSTQGYIPNTQATTSFDPFGDSFSAGNNQRFNYLT